MSVSRAQRNPPNTEHGASEAARDLLTSAWLANCESFQIPPIFPEVDPWANLMSPPQAEMLIKAWENLSGQHAVHTCRKKHKNPSVSCRVGVVYMIPLCCGKNYVGQTKNCVNDRLNEHKNAVIRNKAGNLATHCHRSCKPNFTQCIIIAMSEEQLKREIIESWVIKNLGEACVNEPSIKLTCKSMKFLNSVWKKYAWFFRSFKCDVFWRQRPG